MNVYVTFFIIVFCVINEGLAATGESGDYDFLVAIRSQRTKEHLFSGTIISSRSLITSCEAIATFSKNGHPSIRDDIDDLRVNVGVSFAYGGPIEILKVKDGIHHNKCHKTQAIINFNLGLLRVPVDFTSKSDSALKFALKGQRKFDIKSLIKKKTEFRIFGWSVINKDYVHFYSEMTKLEDIRNCAKFFCYPISSECINDANKCSLGPSRICGNNMGSAVAAEDTLWAIVSQVFNPCKNYTVRIVTILDLNDEWTNQALNDPLSLSKARTLHAYLTFQILFINFL